LSPSKPFSSKESPLSTEGEAAKGQIQARICHRGQHICILALYMWDLTLLVPIPCLKLAHMPMSYGNSCRRMRIRCPSGPVRYPPSTLLRRSNVSCLSISHPSIVVVLTARHQAVRTNIIPTANSVNELTTISTNRCASCHALGPR